MAGLSAREQFLTVAWLRWRVFRNGLRSRQRAAEAISGVFVFILMLMFGLGPAIGFAFGSYYAVASGDARFLPIFFWVTFLYWQFFPAIALTMTEVVDTSTFLRFPVSLPTYYTLWLAFGSLDPSLLVPLLWMFGIFCGISFANPALIPWAILVLLSFALVNLLLSRLIIAYFERWMAQRKTREIVGALVAFMGIGIQLVSNLFSRYAFQRHHPPMWERLSQLQQNLPPGAAARAITLAPHQFSIALFEWAVLLAYIVMFGGILAIRLKAQFSGENFSETAKRGKVEKRERTAPANRGWLALPDPIGAVFEKEIRTLISARQLWIVLIAPPLMLLVFGNMGGRHQSPLAHSPYTLPGGAAYALLTLSSFFCNIFSSELAGIQFLYLAPVRFRQIVIGKNIAHILVAIVQFLILLIGVSLVFRPPAPAMLLITVAALTFAVFSNLAAGNLLSFYFPKKVDYARMGRQQGSSATGLIMLGVQLATIAVALPVILFAHFFGSDWMAAAAFVVLAALAFATYRAILNNIDAVALKKRKSLIAELTKAS